MKWKNNWNAPCWIDNLGPYSRELYSKFFAPVVGYNPWLWRISE